MGERDEEEGKKNGKQEYREGKHTEIQKKKNSKGLGTRDLADTWTHQTPPLKFSFFWGWI